MEQASSAVADLAQQSQTLQHLIGEMKRQGFNPMNLSHGRCQRILRDAK